MLLRSLALSSKSFGRGSIRGYRVIVRPCCCYPLSAAARLFPVLPSSEQGIYGPSVIQYSLPEPLTIGAAAYVGGSGPSAPSRSPIGVPPVEIVHAGCSLRV